MIHTASALGHRLHPETWPAQCAVSGRTARGIFLTPRPGQVVFLSTENYHGPLTINLSGLPAARVGDSVRYAGLRLVFAYDGTALDLAGAARWLPPAPPLSGHSARQALELTHAVAAEIRGARPAVGLAPLLSRLLEGAPAAGDAETDRAARALETWFNEGDTARFLLSLLGLGRGLTPAGDDLAVGYLLARARGSRARAEAEFNRTICAAARERTTTLSAELIAAAAAGSADERLLLAYDALLDGSRSAAQILALLSAYGSSSGCDAFTGMALYLLETAGVTRPARPAGAATG